MINFIKKHILHTKTLTMVAGLVALGAFIAAGYMISSMPQEAEASNHCRTVDVTDQFTNASASASGREYSPNTTVEDEDEGGGSINPDNYTNTDEEPDVVNFTLTAEAGGNGSDGSANANLDMMGASVSRDGTNSDPQKTESFTREATSGSNISGYSYAYASAADRTQSSASAKFDSVALTVCEVDTNNPPVAVDDGSSSDRIPLEEGETKDIDVLANDYDPDGDYPLTITSASAQNSGITATADVVNGKVRYDTGNAVDGDTDVINYTIEDNKGAVDTASAYIDVNVTGGTGSVSIEAPQNVSYNPTWNGSHIGGVNGPEDFIFGLSTSPKTFAINQNDISVDGKYNFYVNKNTDYEKTNSVYSAELGLSHNTNDPPNASFTYDPTDPVAGEAILFNSGPSSDPDNNISYVSWDFGDGSPGNTGGQGTITRDYDSSGTYNVTLTVVDGEGLSDSTSKTVNVAPVPNNPPSASFSYSPSNPSTGETVTFDGSASSDSDGSINLYDWDFGDGTSNTGGSTQVSHSYSSTGSYTASLRVRDDDSADDTITKTISVTQANRAPTADAAVSEITETSYNLSGSGSSDPDGDSLTYDWVVVSETNGSANISYPDSENTPASFLPEYGSSGSFEVQLTVSDGEYSDSDTTGNVFVPCQSGCGGGGGGDKPVLTPY